MKNTLLGLLAAVSLLIAAHGSAGAQELSADALDRLSSHGVGAAVCAECHESEVTVSVFHRDCQACHTNATAHATARRPARVEPGKPGVAQCEGCHAKDAERMNFAFSDHHKAGLECSDCHGVHGPKLKVGGQSIIQHRTQEGSALCATCHQDVLARFNMPSHHPVLEGGVSCLGCHDPHSSKKLSLADQTQQCLDCHQRLRGPHVFEHAPVVEDCANCHDPHGSPNARLLVAGQPMLCLQCHSLPNNRHGLTGSNALTSAALSQRTPGAVLRDCVACHGQIHGSAQDQHLRY